MAGEIYFTLNAPMFSEPANVPLLLRFSYGEGAMRDDCDECFQGSLPDRILDIPNITEADFRNLCAIFAASPLYKVQLIFALDRLLILRHNQDVLAKEVAKAFHPIAIPEPVMPQDSGFYKFEGGLFHPFLDQLKDEELVQIYVNCLHASALQQDAQARECLDFCSIINVNAQGFLQYYNGFTDDNIGCADAAALLPLAERYGGQADMTIEDYTQRGQETAQSMAFSAPQALLEAWLHADYFQASLAQLLDAVLKKYKDAPSYRWIRHDIFRILEREAMKQVFAVKLQKKAANSALQDDLRQCPLLASAIENNAADGIDAHIQQLFSQILSQEQRYASSAAKFAVQSIQRYQEYKDHF